MFNNYRQIMLEIMPYEGNAAAKQAAYSLMSRTATNFNAYYPFSFYKTPQVPWLSRNDGHDDSCLWANLHNIKELEQRER